MRIISGKARGTKLYTLEGNNTRPTLDRVKESIFNIIQGEIEEAIVLDLFAGSGAIGISIAKYVPNAKIYAIDISEKALEIARKNARKQKVEKQIKFRKSNLFEKIKGIKFDIIVSNPPYIKKGDIKYLSEEVQKEPQIALDGGYDGLDFYRKIVKQGIEYLKLDSYLCLEIGYDQKEEVIEIIENEKKYKNTYCKKDLYGNDRVIVTRVGG